MSGDNLFLPTPSNVPYLRAGDILGGNYFQVEEDGTWINKGNSTTWDDLVGSLIGRRLNDVPGTVDYNWAENTITLAPNGNISAAADRIIFNYQYPHAAITDGVMNLHIHWEQPNATVRTFTVQYRIQSNNTLKTTSWTTVNVNTGGANDAFTYPGSGTFNQITRLVSVDMTGFELSSTVQFRFTRSDSNAGDIEAVFVDAHVERNMNGSRGEFVK